MSDRSLYNRDNASKPSTVTEQVNEVEEKLGLFARFKKSKWCPFKDGE